MQISHQLLPGGRSGKHIDPVRLLSGVKGRHLQKIADHLAVMMTGIFTAFDHMLIINEHHPRLRGSAHIIMLGIRRKQKRFTNYTVLIQFIDDILLSIFITAVKHRPSLLDQPDLFHRTGIFHNGFSILKNSLPDFETDTHSFLFFGQNIRK